MKKILFTLLLACGIANANTIGAIAFTVNEEPVTSYDIKEKMAQLKMSKPDAVSEMIDEILFNQEVAKKNITADVFDINNHLEKIAAANGMDLYTFKGIIRQKYKDYAAFEEQTKQQILKQKLAQKIVRGKLNLATEDDLKIYYNANKTVFTTAKNVKAIQYTSKSKKALIAARKNPITNDSAISKTSINLEQDKLNSQLKFLINDTNENTFTPIFTANKQYVSLLIVKKEGVSVLPFESVKERIFNVIMREREKTYLKEYFEKLKLTADIKIVR